MLDIVIYKGNFVEIINGITVMNKQSDLIITLIYFFVKYFDTHL